MACQVFVRRARKLVKGWVGEGSYDEIEKKSGACWLRPNQDRVAGSYSEATAFAKIGEPLRRITEETYIGDDRGVPVR